MLYSIEINQTAIKDLKSLDRKEALRITEKIKTLENNLSGNVKKLTNFIPEYRLRVGDYRVLFGVEGQNVIVYRIKHRKEAYR
jgi:mRNA interferase RelE/StbE